MSKMKAYFQHELSGLVADEEASGYGVDNLLILLEGSLWKGTTTGDQNIAFDAGVGNTISADYIGAANHNLSGANFELQCSDTNFLEIATTNLFLFGDFQTVSGMTPVLASQAIVAGGESGNCLEITNSGAAAGSCNQVCTGLVVGKYYRFKAYFKKGTGVSGSIKVGTTTDDDAYGSFLGLTDAGWTAYEIEFKATETTARVTFSNESIVAAETSFFDTVTMYIMDILSVVDFTPSNNFPFLKEFITQDKRYWRIHLSSLSSIPFMGIAYWGDLSEWSYPSLFDPSAEEDRATINESETGYLLGINIKFIRRVIDVKFRGVLDGSSVWLALRAWWDSNGMSLLFISWDIDNHPDDIFLVRPEKDFKGPFITSVYREVSLKFTGRVSK